MKKIHVFYSHYNVEGKGNKSRPEWFDYEKCFVNFLNTTKQTKDVNLHVIMDGKIENNWINKYLDYYKPYEIEGGGMEKVTLAFYSVIKNHICDEEDLIYVLENDYLHTFNWVNQIQTLYKEFNNISYVSLYDHNDKYFLPLYDDLVSKIWTTSKSHWRSTPSTCGSYITTKKIIMEDYNDHTGVTVPIGDHHKWLFLNQTKNRSIITPIPGLSTHCMLGLLSPTIDWKILNN
jgi:hypothetical protein